jgi:alcohol dehydrogenase
VVIPSFTLGPIPRLVFGDGSLDRMPAIAASLGRKILVVTGRRSLRESSRWPELTAAFDRHHIAWDTMQVPGEPSPGLVDDAVARFRSASFEAVVAIGGGSAIDAGKAIAGLLVPGNSVMDHLEGVGRGMPYRGPALPCIAVPMTAGTGSEATRNAVLSEPGPAGFKKSFRHELLVPRHAVVDPTLLATCPPEVLAADAMDAITQLVESLVSSRSTPLTDALAWSGLEAARDGLWPLIDGRAGVDAGRRNLAYAAFLSGITLSHAGLGAVHGLAAPLGARTSVPHGAACGTLLAACTAANIRALEQRDAEHPALTKYERLARLLARGTYRTPGHARASLIQTFAEWTERIALPVLSDFGIQEADLPAIVASCREGSMMTNPVVLTDAEITEVLRQRL